MNDQPDVMALAFATAQETTRRVLATLNMPTLKPATVSTWAHDSTLALVTIDGDTSPVQALNATTSSLRPGDRVMVTLYPPAGVAVTGVLSGHRDPTVVGAAGAAVSTPRVTFTTLPFGSIVGDVAVMTPFAGAVSPQVAGRYHIEATVRYDLNNKGWRRTAIRRGFSTDMVVDQRVATIVPGDGAAETVVSFSVDVDLDLYETIEVRALQGSDGALDALLWRFAMSRIGARSI